MFTGFDYHRKHAELFHPPSDEEATVVENLKETGAPPPIVPKFGKQPI